MNVSEVIRTKRAVRQFQDKPLPSEAVRAILNAGRRAQSSKNTQPWQFIAVHDKATLGTMAKLGNYVGHLAGAALGVAILTHQPDQRFSVMFDAGQAAAYMQLAAWDLLLPSLSADGPFDFVFIDAEKPGYTDYYYWAINNIRLGGVIAAHNAFRGGSVVGIRANDEYTATRRTFNPRVARDDRLISTIFPAGDGTLICVRIK
jgi:nitroreductase